MTKNLDKVHTSCLAGKLPRQAGMILVRHDQQYELTLQPEMVAVSGAKLPTIDEKDDRLRREERIGQVRHLIETLDLLYAAFLKRRLASGWTEELKRMRQWLQQEEGGSGNLVYSTFLGGSDSDYSVGVAVDAAGNAYVTGSAGSANFPTRNGLQAYGGGGDAFVAKYTPAGALAWSTFLGGSGTDNGWGVAVDVGGSIYLTGLTTSTNLPTTPGVVQPVYGGGSNDGYVAKLAPDGSLAYLTYLGGAGTDNLLRIAVDGLGLATVVGQSNSDNYPTANAIQATRHGDYDAVITRLNADGSQLQYSTYLGGRAFDKAHDVVLGDLGVAYVVGLTLSSDWPTFGPLQGTLAGGQDALLFRITDSAPVLFNPGDQSNFHGDGVRLPILAADPGSSPLTFTATGLPAGLTIDPATGEISGRIALDADQASPYAVVVSVTDGTVTQSAHFQWTVGHVELDNPGNQSNVAGDLVELPLAGFDKTLPPRVAPPSFV